MGQNIEKLVENKDIRELNLRSLLESIKKEKDIKRFAPFDYISFDPRTADYVVFNPSRKKRKHDYKEKKESFKDDDIINQCPICNGNTTKIVDIRKLNDGTYTFINKNLFPIVYPENKKVYGGHFLQWISSAHYKDFDNMELNDIVIVLKALADLEYVLLDGKKENLSTQNAFVHIIRNYGKRVGGSLSHPHQQIVLSNVPNRSKIANYSFYQDKKMFFSEYMLKNTPKELIVKDFKTGLLLVPYFMKRPYDAMYVVKSFKPHLFLLDEQELLDMAKVLKMMISFYKTLFRILQKETAFNILYHTGPGAGFYVEFLPHTQEFGGYEKLGLFVCQDTPWDVAKHIRESL